MYWAECINMLISFTSGQRDSPHCYTLSPAEAYFQFYGGRWEKPLNPNFALRGTKYFLHKQQEALSIESVQDKCGTHKLQTQTAWMYQDIKYLNLLACGIFQHAYAYPPIDLSSLP